MTEVLLRPLEAEQSRELIGNLLEIESLSDGNRNDYATADTRNYSFETSSQFEILGFRLEGNRYFGPLTVGLEMIFQGLTECCCTG